MHSVSVKDKDLTVIRISCRQFIQIHERSTLLCRGFQREKEGREGGREEKGKERLGNLCHQAISRWPPSGGRC